MIVSFRISDEAGRLMKEYADLKGLTVSALLRGAVQERIDEDFIYNLSRMEVMRERPVYTARKKKKRKKPAQKK